MVEIRWNGAYVRKVMCCALQNGKIGAWEGKEKSICPMKLFLVDDRGGKGVCKISFFAYAPETEKQETEKQEKSETENAATAKNDEIYRSNLQKKEKNVVIRKIFVKRHRCSWKPDLE